jgi:hypothetical protein
METNAFTLLILLYIYIYNLHNFFFFYLENIIFEVPSTVNCTWLILALKRRKKYKFFNTKKNIYLCLMFFIYLF